MAGPGPTGGPNRWLPTTSPVLRQSSPGPTTGPGPVPGLDLETLPVDARTSTGHFSQSSIKVKSSYEGQYAGLS